MNYRTNGWILIILSFLLGGLGGGFVTLGMGGKYLLIPIGLLFIALAILCGWRGATLLHKWSNLKNIIEGKK